MSRQKRRDRREAEIFSLQPTEENEQKKKPVKVGGSKDQGVKKQNTLKAAAEVEMSRQSPAFAENK